MGNKPPRIPIESLDEIQLPTLDRVSEEEAIYETTEASTHKNYKESQANQAALEEAQQKIRKLEIQNDDLAKLGPHRRRYSWWIFGFVSIFVAITFSILVLSSLQFEYSNSNGDHSFYTILKLDNSVLDTLLQTNMIQAIGLLLIVAKWLFSIKEVIKEK